MNNRLDVLLINVPTSKKYKKGLAEVSSMPPLGIMYIASCLKKYNYTVKIIDMAVEFFDKSEFRRKLLEENPRMIGISSFVESWSAIKVITKFIKSILPNVIISAGGPFATFRYKQVLNETLIDYVTFAEGEYVVKNLADSIIRNIINVEDVDGIAFRKNGKIFLTKPNERIKDLDSLEFPDRDLINLEKYVYPITISTARGCPGKCMFCSSRAYWGKKIFFRTPENIIKEILEVEQKYQDNMFFIVDDTFTINTERAMKFCDLLLKTNKKFIWGCESRADVVSEELLNSLYKAGCRKIQFGMESANNEILKKLGKKVTIEQIENATSIAANIGFDINISFIIGHAFDTHETVRETINFALMLKKKYQANVLASINTPYPGTELYKNHESYGIELLTDDWDSYTMNEPVINTKYLTAVQIKQYHQSFINALTNKDKRFIVPNICMEE
ncbi:B12-binding domain-containing radical SAM protein [Clostridium perfringens]|uniref:B12-binding domain-containing radical SAM protein n=1 Tax=Clostridium perfringens TaxID=1502 RepID=UPI0024BC9C9E|nr:radical SAM protein [Clostridium perfringens]ELC8463949.1 radical SAM protein [Clostridium perfringens]